MSAMQSSAKKNKKTKNDKKDAQIRHGARLFPRLRNGKKTKKIIDSIRLTTAKRPGASSTDGAKS